MTEEWRDIPGFEGLYEISNYGRVKSLERVVKRVDGRDVKVKGRYLKQHSLPSGHVIFDLWKENKVAQRLAHRLVMEAFVGVCPPGHEVLHYDGNPLNNHVSNLRYGTRSENIADTLRHGRHAQANRTHCRRGHELKEPNLVPCKLKKGVRQCLACARAQSYTFHHKHLQHLYKEISDRYHEEILKKAVAGSDC